MIRPSFKPRDFSIFDGKLFTIRDVPSEFLFSNLDELIRLDIVEDSSGGISSATLDGTYIDHIEAFYMNIFLNSCIFVYDFEKHNFYCDVNDFGYAKIWKSIDPNFKENIEQSLKIKVLSKLRRQHD